MHYLYLNKNCFLKKYLKLNSLSSDILCPTLIIGGRLDNFAPEQMSEALKKKIPNSRLEIIDMAGHFAPAQRKEIINKLICDFISKLE